MVMVMRRVVMRRKSGGRMMRNDERRAANSDQRIVLDRRTMKGRPSRRWLINMLLNCCHGRCSIEAPRGKQSALIKKQHVLRSKQPIVECYLLKANGTF